MIIGCVRRETNVPGLRGRSLTERGICSLTEYLIFVMRMNHDREAPLRSPRCDYMVSVTYTCKEPRRFVHGGVLLSRQYVGVALRPVDGVEIRLPCIIMERRVQG